MFLMSLETWRSEVKTQADLLTGENLRHDSCWAFTQWAEEQISFRIHSNPSNLRLRITD